MSSDCITINEPRPPRSTPAGTGRTYNESVRIKDTGNAAATPFVNPDPGGMLGSDWEKASR